MTSEYASPEYQQELGGGLALRWATSKDIDSITQLYGMVWRGVEDDPPNLRMIDQIQRHMRGDFPLTTWGDCALVEDTSHPRHPIVAAAFLWSHQWTYDGIAFPVGRPESVATDPAYRNRGLVRQLFELLHARSMAEGHLLQAITGIPFFYRQFGYEYALDLGGQRIISTTQIPTAKSESPGPYQLREATRRDVPSLMQFYQQRQAESLVWSPFPQTYWEYLVDQWEHPSMKGKDPMVLGIHERLFMLINEHGQNIGYASLATKRWGNDLPVYALELAPEVDLERILPSFLRVLERYGQSIPPVKPQQGPLSEISFCLGRSHPLYPLLEQAFTSRQELPYAWYVRVPDLVAFLQCITPALERRLSASSLSGYTGEMKLTLYRGGLHFVFEEGTLQRIEPWDAPAYGSLADAGCPALTFLQLLFGYRGLGDLRPIFPDVWANEQATTLLTTLFPAHLSWVLP